MTEQRPPSILELLDLSGQSVLVTGASGNIGQGIARRLAAAGATVIAHYYRDDKAARGLIDDIGAGTAAQADLSSAPAVEALLAQTIPDLIVNNAAIQPVQMLADTSPSDWRSVHAANLDSAFFVTRCAARSWQAKGCGGAIVNIASIEGSDPAAGHGHYASSKAGLIMLTRACALEYGPAGIRVNAVSPGLIDRAGLADAWPEGVDRWLDRAPLGRLGTPNDVADAVLFLLSPAARWISGANLVVDGGMSAQNRW
jgi:NAD(P)-dependent dehydrogenase (short-subunit alcohol dehydrogenase family)